MEVLTIAAVSAYVIYWRCVWWNSVAKKMQWNQSGNLLVNIHLTFPHWSQKHNYTHLLASLQKPLCWHCNNLSWACVEECSGAWCASFGSYGDRLGVGTSLASLACHSDGHGLGDGLGGGGASNTTRWHHNHLNTPTSRHLWPHDSQGTRSRYARLQFKKARPQLCIKVSWKSKHEADKTLLYQTTQININIAFPKAEKMNYLNLKSYLPESTIIKLLN